MLTFTRADQDDILAKAARATASTGWANDAIGFLAQDRSFDPPRDVAVGVFQRFEGDTAEFHFAMLEGRIRMDVMRAMRFVAFHAMLLNLAKVWAIIPERNTTAQVAALKAGFAFEHRKRGGIVGGGDAIVLSMVNHDRAPARPPETMR